MSKHSKHIGLETKKRPSKQWSIETSKKNKKRKKNPQFLSGMILAISTLQEESSNSNSELSYCKVAEMVRACGAQVSGQVHKKVHCVLCTPAAITKATQRVRKGKKFKIPLVNIEWIHQCIEKGEKLPLDLFLLKYPEVQLTTVKLQDENKNGAEDDNQSVDNDDLPDAGWTSPVDVGCCCVCHENGTEADCEWCKDCKKKERAKRA